MKASNRSAFIVTFFAQCFFQILTAGCADSKRIQYHDVTLSYANLERGRTLVDEFDKGFQGKYRNVDITLYEKHIDLDKDQDDWFNSTDLQRILDEAKNDSIHSYMFSSSQAIKRRTDSISADFLVISAFEPNDIRLQRNYVRFLENKVYVAVMSYSGGYSTITQKLRNLGFVKKRSELGEGGDELVWNYKANMIDQASRKIVERRLDIEEISSWYSNTDRIVELVESL